MKAVDRASWLGGLGQGGFMGRVPAMGPVASLVSWWRVFGVGVSRCPGHPMVRPDTSMAGRRTARHTHVAIHSVSASQRFVVVSK